MAFCRIGSTPPLASKSARAASRVFNRSRLSPPAVVATLITVSESVVNLAGPVVVGSFDTNDVNFVGPADIASFVSASDGDLVGPAEVDSFVSADVVPVGASDGDGPSSVDFIGPSLVDTLLIVTTVASVWAVVPGSIVVPPASLNCPLSIWIFIMSALYSNTKELNSSIFLEIKFVCITTIVPAFSLALFLAAISSDRSVGEHLGDKILWSRLARIATMLIALTGS